MIKRQYIDINEVIENYLPMSKKKARKFVIRYLDHKRIGNKIYVDRIKLEELLKREDVESFQAFLSARCSDDKEDLEILLMDSIGSN